MGELPMLRRDQRGGNFEIATLKTNFAQLNLLGDLHWAAGRLWWNPDHE